MPAVSNGKLKKSIARSAIKNSLVPVIVCDENFTVCMKSIGATRLIPKPAQNSSILPHISEDTAKEMEHGNEPICALFTTPGSEVFTVITGGMVEGEKYYALIFEPRILLVPTEVPQYMAESYRNLCDAAKELINLKSGNFSRLERSAAALLRLADFSEKNSAKYLQSKAGFVDICKELETVINQYAELFSTVGMSISLRRLSHEPQICAYPLDVIHIFAAVLVSVAALLSADGDAEFVCGPSEERDSHVKISVTVTSDRNDWEIENIRDLASYAVPLRLELAAIIDMAERYGFKLICTSDNEKLSIGWEVEVRKSAVIKLHAPAKHTSADLRRMIAELFDIVIAGRKV